ncbi:MAG: Bax inhibitor-1/YccA family protein [Oscillospiraceae bacterium]|nr:Bax inhibitor-1/YccA family protein [Oscillospiraceae bacterium]
MNHFANADYGEQYQAARRAYFTRTYGMMAAGLAVTFLTALFVAMFFPGIVMQPLIVIGLCIAELIVVVQFSRTVATASYQQAVGKFMLYALLTGVTFASIFLSFDISSIFLCFLSTAVGFGAMALIGATTKRDLSGMANMLFGGLVALVVLMVVGLFLRTTFLELFISFLGILVFMGMTAYDTQKLGRMFDQAGGSEMAERYSVYAALQLYLDFINLFLYLLRLLSVVNRRSN